MEARRQVRGVLYSCKQETMIPGKYSGPGNTRELMVRYITKEGSTGFDDWVRESDEWITNEFWGWITLLKLKRESQTGLVKKKGNGFVLRLNWAHHGMYSRGLERKELIKILRAGDTGLRESYIAVVIGAIIINVFIRKKWRKKEKREAREENPGEKTQEQ